MLVEGNLEGTDVEGRFAQVVRSEGEIFVHELTGGEGQESITVVNKDGRVMVLDDQGIREGSSDDLGSVQGLILPWASKGVAWLSMLYDFQPQNFEVGIRELEQSEDSSEQVVTLYLHFLYADARVTAFLDAETKEVRNREVVIIVDVPDARLEVSERFHAVDDGPLPLPEQLASALAKGN